MSPETEHLLRQSHRLERNMASLYLLLCERFPEDRSFWWRLCLEEQNHAAIFNSVMTGQIPKRFFPQEILVDDIHLLETLNAEIEALLATPSPTLDTRESACLCAASFEERAGERRFQQALDEENLSSGMRMIATLNREDRDHARRILAYAGLEKQSLPPAPEDD